MTDHTELKRLAETAYGAKFQTEGFEQADGRGQHYGGLILHENGHTIIASCVMQPWADFIAAADPAAVLDLVTENDELLAEVAGLKTGYQAYERVNAELKAEVEGLRTALTYIRDSSDDWHVCEKAADALADASMGKGEQS